MPDPDGVLTPDEASKAAVDDSGQPLSKWKRAEMKRELEDWNRRMGKEPPPKPPVRVWISVSLSPQTLADLDTIGVAMGETKRGRIIDMLVRDRSVEAKCKVSR